MSKRSVFALVLFAATIHPFVATNAYAVEPVAVVKSPSVAKVGKLIRLDAADSKGDGFLWESMTGEDFAVDSGGKVAWFVAGSPGKYRFLLVAVGVVDGKAQAVKAVAEVLVDGPPPAPIPPAPVPTPIPDPTPSPIPPGPVVVDNLRVVFLYESSAKITRQQLLVLNSPKIDDYLSSRCANENGIAAWRRLDKDVDASRESAEWQSVLAAAKADPSPLPRVAIFSGTRLVKSATLPATADETLALLQLYGGR